MDLKLLRTTAKVQLDLLSLEVLRGMQKNEAMTHFFLAFQEFEGSFL